METEYASLSDRVKSIFIDTVLIVILMFVASSILENYENAPDWVHIAIFVALWLLYEPVCVAVGCTLGQYMMNIRVRRASDVDRHVNIVLSYLRYAIKVVLGWLSFLTIGTSDQRRAVHDLAVGSVMIKVNQPTAD